MARQEGVAESRVLVARVVVELAVVEFLEGVGEMKVRVDGVEFVVQIAWVLELERVYLKANSGFRSEFEALAVVETLSV